MQKIKYPNLYLINETYFLFNAKKRSPITKKGIDHQSQCVRRGKYQTDSQNENHFYFNGPH